MTGPFREAAFPFAGQAVYRVILHRLGSLEVGEGWPERWARRAWTIPGYVCAWLVSLGLAPFAALGVLLGAGVVARLALFAAVYLSYEMAGLSAAAGLFLAGRARDA